QFHNMISVVVIVTTVIPLTVSQYDKCSSDCNYSNTSNRFHNMISVVVIVTTVIPLTGFTI
ncbi:hypothetical protein HMPREF9980_08073, partial [Staphylococcus epidermidis NIHLM031]